jgi:O-antigen/teichoic acid export membrane protein
VLETAAGIANTCVFVHLCVRVQASSKCAARGHGFAHMLLVRMVLQVVIVLHFCSTVAAAVTLHGAAHS